MTPGSAQAFEALLARFHHEVEEISEAQHRLARQSALLREQITRLRLGASPTAVRRALKTLAADWPAIPMRAAAPDGDGRRHRDRSL
jgi:hypothetical protein